MSIFCLIGLLLFPAFTAFAQDAKPARLFELESGMEVELTGPWRELTSKKSYKGSYPGSFRYVDELGNEVTLPMTVERRGVTRQQFCRYPPIRLRFDKEDVKGTTFRGQKSLKMVTHCDRSSRFEQYYIMEMLAYRMYNLITDRSFRVRPLYVTYKDSGTGKEGVEKFAFLIEDDGDVADRFGLKKVKVASLRPSQLEPVVSSQFSLFQYMIGNVDWAALSGPDPEQCCHNVKLIGPKPFGNGDLATPLPYDFDSAGIVNAHYAAPPDGVPIRTVRQRLYRGYCLSNSTMEEARALYRQKEDEIYAVLESEDGLLPHNRNKARKYLSDFFKTLGDDRDFEKKITSKCRK